MGKWHILRQHLELPEQTLLIAQSSEQVVSFRLLQGDPK